MTKSYSIAYKDKNGNRKSQRHPWFDTLNNDEKGILEFKFHRNLTQELIQLKQLKYGSNVVSILCRCSRARQDFKKRIDGKVHN